MVSSPIHGKTWRCRACAFAFDDEEAAPRCPRCLRTSTVERAPATVAAPSGEPGGGELAALDDDAVPTPAERDRRNGRALAFATVPAILAALLAAGWFGERWDPRVVLVIAVSGGPIAGWLVGVDRADRVFTSVAAMIGGVGVVSATAFYISSRDQIVSVEVLLPMLLGAVPGLVAFYVFRKLAPLLLPRLALAAVAVAATIVLVTSC